MNPVSLLKVNGKQPDLDSLPIRWPL